MAKKDKNNGAKQSGGWQKVTPPPASPEENGAALSQTDKKPASNQKQSETPSKEEETKKSTTPPTKSAGAKQRQNKNNASKKKNSAPAQKAAQPEKIDIPNPETPVKGKDDTSKDKTDTKTNILEDNTKAKTVEDKSDELASSTPPKQGVAEQSHKISKEKEEEEIIQKYGLEKPTKPSKNQSEVVAKGIIIKMDEPVKTAESIKTESTKTESTKKVESSQKDSAKKLEEKPKSEPSTKTQPKAQERVSDKKTASTQKSQAKRSSQKAAKRRYDDDWEEDMRLNGGSRKYTAAVPIGGIFVLLALIGLITVIMFSVQATERLIDNSKEKEMFGNLILPVLMFDPVPFENPSEITEIPLLRSSIWSAITQNMDKYTFVEGTAITVPKSDVDVACARLFGPGVTLKHQSFEDDISLYSYNVDIQSYYIPADANILYTPQVEEISKKGDIFSLTVGYIAPNTQWMETLRGEKSEPIPSKYMIYEMKKVDDHYQLVSIKDPPEGAVPGVPQIQPQDAITVPGGDQNNGGIVEIQPLEPAIEGETSPDGNTEGEGAASTEEGSTSEAV